MMWYLVGGSPLVPTACMPMTVASRMHIKYLCLLKEQLTHYDALFTMILAKHFSLVPGEFYCLQVANIGLPPCRECQGDTLKFEEAIFLVSRLGRPICGNLFLK